MKGRWWLNIGLLVVLVALGLLIWFKPGAESKKPKTTITTLVPASIKTIRIAQPNQKTAVFKRQGGHWQMLKPIAAPADGALIKNWLASVDEASTRSYPIKGLDLKQFGLKPPKLTLTLNDQKLEFGSSDPLDHQRYIRRGDTVYLANDMLFYQLQGDPLSFVSKRLLPKDAKIVALTLPNLKVTHADNGDWQLTPTKPKIDSDQIQKLIDAWQRAQAFNVKSIDTSKSTGEVVVQLQGRKEPIHFNILKNDSVLALARPKLGVEYQLPANRRDDLLKLTPKSNKSADKKPK
ncbi:MAG TPA: DUF4340 domain-containing protein [Gammaproteobacteria bacterium]|nr:DUF4340 domain-containing protein [Gammaproteobacteria bacterium]